MDPSLPPYLAQRLVGRDTLTNTAYLPVGPLGRKFNLTWKLLLSVTRPQRLFVLLIPTRTRRTNGWINVGACASFSRDSSLPVVIPSFQGLARLALPGVSTLPGSAAGLPLGVGYVCQVVGGDPQGSPSFHLGGRVPFLVKPSCGARGGKEMP